MTYGPVHIADQPIDVITTSSALPTGAATEAKQDDGITKLTSIDGKVSTETTLSSVDTTLSNITYETYESITSVPVVPGHHEAFSVHLDAEDVQTTTGYMLIDLSDTTNWPHTATNHIDIEKICINVDPNTNYAGDVEIGFLTNVDASNGDFNIIQTWHLDRGGSNFSTCLEFAFGGPLHINTDVWFGPTVANDTTWQTDVNLQGPDNAINYPSGNGDLVMKVTRTAGSVDVGVLIMYHTD
jgi:hypothetical protein